MRNIIYIVIVAGFYIGGTMDAVQKDWKSAVTAWLFATANAVIFFWK